MVVVGVVVVIVGVVVVVVVVLVELVVEVTVEVSVDVEVEGNVDVDVEKVTVGIVIVNSFEKFLISGVVVVVVNLTKWVVCFFVLKVIVLIGLEKLLK